MGRCGGGGSSGCVLGHDMAWQCGYRKAMVESDYLGLIAKLKRKDNQNSTLGRLVIDIISLANVFDFCSFIHVKR